MQEFSEILLVVQSDAEKALGKAVTPADLESIKIRFLGKKGIVTEHLKRIGSLPPEQRKEYGQAVNRIKVRITEQIALHQQTLQNRVSGTAQHDGVDVTQPGRSQSSGTIHPISRAQQRMISIFDRVGFASVTGPEIEDDYHNFEALNIPANHPARAMHDTFYIDSHHVLRTHTSPVQIRHMENHAPPIRIIAPGRVYRCDSDITHTPMFHQLEGLAVDTDITFSDLKGILIFFIREFFEKELPVRFRSSYFPFTEPSAEMDMGCVFCEGTGCRVCKHTGWIEVLGCGMVHPRVMEYGKVDSTEYTGYAFGLGIERLTMLRYGVNDLRLFFSNDLAFLKQF